MLINQWSCLVRGGEIRNCFTFKIVAEMAPLSVSPELRK